MRALVKARPGPGLELRDIDPPEVGPNDVLIDVTHAAICGTDLHIYEWDEWASETIVPPTTIGHEFVGTVAAVGDQIAAERAGMAIGARVAGEGHIVCGNCRNCRAGAGHLCRNTIGIGIHRDGGFADQVVIPASNVYPIPDSVSDEIAAILDPLGNAVHTALSFELVGEDILITGAGPIGQMAAAICRHAGARHIVVSDPRPSRLAVADRMGASRAVEPGERSLRATMAELGMTEGFDIALEMSGSGDALHDIVATVNHGAKVGLLGLFREMPEVDLNQIIFKSITVLGIYGREMFDTWYKAVAMLDSGLDVTPVISHRFPLDQYEAAFEALASGEASKVILDIRP